MRKQMTKNKTLAEHHDGGPEGQGGAQQGTGARGEQYLDALARSHKIARKVLFGTSTGSAPEQIHTSRKKSSLTDCPFFRSKRTFILISLDKLNKLTEFLNPLNTKDGIFLIGTVWFL